jgi:hypothetical protein
MFGNNWPNVSRTYGNLVGLENGPTHGGYGSAESPTPMFFACSASALSLGCRAEPPLQLLTEVQDVVFKSGPLCTIPIEKSASLPCIIVIYIVPLEIACHVY